MLLLGLIVFLDWMLKIIGGHCHVEIHLLGRSLCRFAFRVAEAFDHGWSTFGRHETSLNLNR